MPFQSKSQRRKFYALKSQGKMDQATIDEWEKDTPKNIPERVEKMAGFFTGFEKRAAESFDAKGFSKHEKKKFKKFKMHDRKKWMNPPPDYTETMSPRKFKRWASGTDEGRNYARMDMGE